MKKKVKAPKEKKPTGKKGAGNPISKWLKKWMSPKGRGEMDLLDQWILKKRVLSLFF